MNAADQFWTGVVVILASIVVAMCLLCALSWFGVRFLVWLEDRRRPTVHEFDVTREMQEHASGEREVDVYFTPETEAAIIQALTNIGAGMNLEHFETDPQTEYEVAALRKWADDWGTGDEQ